MKTPSVRFIGRICLLVFAMTCLSFLSHQEDAHSKGKAKDSPFILMLKRHLPGWTIGGDTDIGLNITLGGKKGKKAGGSLRVSIREGEFSSPDGLFSGAGITGILRVGGKTPAGDPIPLTVEAEFTSGEVLLDTLYFNVKDVPLKVGINGMLWPEKRLITDMRGAFEFGDFFRCSWKGDLGNPSGRLNGNIRSDFEIPSVRKVHAFISSVNAIAPLNEGEDSDTYTESQKTGFTGRVIGQCLIEIRGNNVDTSGAVTLYDVGIEIPGGNIGIENLEGTVPFDLPVYRTGSPVDFTDQNSEKSPIAGELRFGKITLNDFIWNNVRLPIRAESNRIEITEPVELALPEGSLRIEGVRADNILPWPFDLRAGLYADGVELSRFLSESASLDLRGRISAEFPLIEIKDGDLKADGSCVAGIWGGKVILKNVWGENLFDLIRRRFGFDVAIEDLQLERATQGFPFGMMSGVLNGDIRNMAFSFGQPDSFELHVRTDPK